MIVRHSKYIQSNQDTDTFRSKYISIIIRCFHPHSHIIDDIYKIQMGIDPCAKLQSYGCIENQENPHTTSLPHAPLKIALK